MIHRQQRRLTAKQTDTLLSLVLGIHADYELVLEALSPLRTAKRKEPLPPETERVLWILEKQLSGHFAQYKETIHQIIPDAAELLQPGSPDTSNNVIGGLETHSAPQAGN